MAFSYYSPVTVQTGQVPSTQTNFPVLVSYTDSRLKTTGGHVLDPNGYDIRPYSNSSLATALTYELEYYNSATGQVVMWVKVPSLADGYVIYLAYGDASLNTNGSSTATWDSNYQGVWHFPDGTTLGLNDSTSNGYNLTNHNAVTATAGQIDGAAGKFNGTNQYLSNASGPVITAGSSITVSFWVLQTTADLQAASAFSVGGSEIPNRIQAHAPYSDDTLYWDYGDFNSGGRLSTSFASQIDKWSYVVLTFDSSGNTHKIFLDGAQAATSSSSNAPTVNQTGINIAAWFGNGLFQKAKFDEFRVSSSYRVLNWTTTEYNNQNAPSTFAVLGTEVPVGGSGLTISVSDTTNVSESVTEMMISYVNKSDTTAITESVTIFIPILTIQVSETTQVTEYLQMGSVIIFDNTANFSSVLTSISGSYTTAGVNRTLIAIVYSASSLFDLQNPTYNGVTMSDAVEIALPAGYPGFLSAFYLSNPASGSNTFAVTRTGTGSTFVAVVSSYYNVEQDGDADGLNAKSALLVNSITASVITNFNNDWTIMGVVSGLAGTLTAGTGSFARTNVSPLWLFDSNGSVGLPNTYSMTATSSAPTDGLAAVILSINPYIFFSTQPNFNEEDVTFVFDVPTLNLLSYVNVSDTTTVTEAVTMQLVSYVSVSDTTAVSDSPTIEVVYLVSKSDTTTITESVTMMSIEQGVVVSDTTAISESVSLSIISYINVSDSTTVSESVSLNVVSPGTINVSDTTTISENVFITITILYLSVSDTTAVSESVTVSNPTVFLSVSDTSAVTESVSESITSYISVSDTTTISESVVIAEISGVIFFTISDSITVTDSVTEFIPILKLSVSDTTVIGEAVFFSAQPILRLSVSDSTTVSDSVNKIGVIVPFIYANVTLKLGWTFDGYVLETDKILTN